MNRGHVNSMCPQFLPEICPRDKLITLFAFHVRPTFSIAQHETPIRSIQRRIGGAQLICGPLLVCALESDERNPIWSNFAFCHVFTLAFRRAEMRRVS